MDWDKYFIGMACYVAMRSKDAETKNGAVVVDGITNTIIGTGYNGFPRGLVDAELPSTRPEKYQYMIHSEINAMVNRDCRGGILYCTMEPCEDCAMMAIQAGIVEIIYLWERKNDVARRMLKMAGVKEREYIGELPLKEFIGVLQQTPSRKDNDEVRK